VELRDVCLTARHFPDRLFEAFEEMLEYELF
jgi:hypothetical protein